MLFFHYGTVDVKPIFLKGSSAARYENEPEDYSQENKKRRMNMETIIGQNFCD